MLLTNEAVEQVAIPRSLLVPASGDDSPRMERRRRRDFVRRMSAIAALRHAGCIVEPVITDDLGIAISATATSEMLAQVEPAIRELAKGRTAHARRTIEELDVSHKSDSEQVDDLLDVAYQSHARGRRSSDALDVFLDTFERWLTRDGVGKVDMLFDRLDLDRVPESLGILLLATTRLTRAHFTRRDAFLERLGRWLVGRSGRTKQHVDNMLRGLRD